MMTLFIMVKVYELKKLKFTFMVVLFLAQNIEITKFFFIKTALIKSKIITIFVKLLYKSFVS